MRTTVDFLDAVKARYSLPSDYALAPYLGVTRASVSRLRNRKDYFGDQTALKVAELLDLSPGIVLSAVHAERAKAPAEKAAWNSIFEKLGGLAAGVLLVSCLLPSPADASVSGPSQAPGAGLYIMSKGKRWRTRRLKFPIWGFFPAFSFFPSF